MNARAKMQEENKKRQFQDNSRTIPAIRKKELIEKGSILFPLQFQ